MRRLLAPALALLCAYGTDDNSGAAGDLEGDGGVVQELGLYVQMAR